MILMIDIFSLCSISFKSAQVLNETVRESIFRNVIALNQIPQELQLIPHHPSPLTHSLAHRLTRFYAVLN